MATVFTAGLAAPALAVAGSTIGAGATILGTMKCSADTSLEERLASVEGRLRRQIREVAQAVRENGKLVIQTKESVMFNGISGIYAEDIKALKVAAKKFERLRRDSNDMIVKNREQKRWMDDILGHAPGSVFAAVENLMSMIRHGQGMYVYFNEY